MSEEAVDASGGGEEGEGTTTSVAAMHLAKGEAEKSAGNAFFQNKEYKKALVRFSRIRAYTWQPSGEAKQYAGSRSKAADMTDEERASLLRLDQIACGNVAQCHLLLGDSKKCMQFCAIVIGKDPDQEHPNKDLLVKALNRSAQAALKLNDLDSAKAFVKRALAIDASSGPARATYKLVQEAFKAYNAEQKKSMSSAFARA